MSRKRIVQLLTSLAVLSCMVLPVQAAPQVNIVPLVQLLLLNPVEYVEAVVVDSGMQGIDSNGDLIGSPFSTTDQMVCFTAELLFGPGTIHYKIEWFDGDTSWAITTDVEITAGVPIGYDIIECIIDVHDDPPPPTPHPSTDWKVILTVNGIDEVEENFEIR